MSIKIYTKFLTTEERLPKNEIELLKKVIKKHVSKAGSILKIPLVNITVYPNSNFTIPETGEGGYAASKDWFHVYIDAAKRKNDLNRIIEKIIPGTIYHEMNHVARWQHTGFGSTLLEVMITEGLASVFAKEQWKSGKDPWSGYSKKELNNLLDIFKQRKKSNDATYNHEEWFYGTGKLPRWIGYKIGSYIIKAFREKCSTLSWEKIVKMSADEIIKLSGVDFEK